MAIVNQIRRQKIRAIFADPQLNHRIAEVIAKEAGAKVLFLDPIGGPNLEGRHTYIDLMNNQTGLCATPPARLAKVNRPNPNR